MSRNTAARTRDDFEDVVETAEELLNTIGDGGGKAVEDLKAKARETLSSARTRLQDATVQARDAATAAAGEADAYVRGNPWMAVAVAGALGVVIGAALLQSGLTVSTARVDSPGTLDRLAALSSSVMRMLYTRVELAGVELALERDSLLQRVEITLIGVVSAGLAGFSAILMAALAVPEQYRVGTLGGLTVLFVIIAISAYLRVRRHAHDRVPLFARLARQLRRDRAVLEVAKARHNPEATP